MKHLSKFKKFKKESVLEGVDPKITDKFQYIDICDDYDSVKSALDNGLDPDFKENLPMRTSIINGRLDIVKLLEEYGVSDENQRNNNTKIAAEYMRFDILDHFVSQGGNYLKDFDCNMYWVAHSFKLSHKDKKTVLTKLQKDYVDTNKVQLRKGPFYYDYDEDTTGDVMTLDQVVAKYGNIGDYFIRVSNVNWSSLNKRLKNNPK